MAKLTGVKTIDMAGGEITKISYKGEEYARISGGAKEGDIMRPNGGHYQGGFLHFEYYTVSGTVRDTVRAVDSNDDMNGVGREHLDIFRKINASPTDGCGLSAKVDDLDKRVTALEQTPVPKANIKTVKRAAKVGERILITGAAATKGYYTNGDILTVRVANAYSRPGSVMVDGFERQIFAIEYEVISDEAPSEPLKVGEVVRVKDGAVSLWEDIQAGQLVKITDNGWSERYPIRAELLDGSNFDYFRERDVERVGNAAHELRKATPAEVAEAKAKAIKEGDIVVITANTNHSRNGVGDIGKVGPIYSFDGGANVDVPNRPDSADANGNFTNMDEMRLATAQERAQYEKALADANKSKLKAGDRVRFTRERFDITAGKAYEVREDSDGGLYILDDDSDRRYAALKYDECVKVDGPTRKFKKGDIVRLKVSSGADDAGTIVEVHMDGGYGYRRLDRDRDRYGGVPNWYELVAPVESRADRV